MSTSFSSDLFILKRDNIPTSLYDAFDNLSQDASFDRYKRCNDPSQLKSVYGSSRNGWASWKLSEILPEFDENKLTFLLGNNARFRREDRLYGSFDQITFLEDPEVLQENILALEDFFKWSLENKEKVSDILEKCSPEELDVIILNTTVSDMPSIDSHIWYAEDGDSVEYLYAYLRSVLAVLKYALENNFAVAYKQDGEFAV